MTDPINARMYDAIEHGLWQDVADALNRLADYGLDPVAALAEQPAIAPGTAVIAFDAGDVIHGGSIRPAGEGYLLRWGVADGDEGLHTGWVVAPRAPGTTS